MKNLSVWITIGLFLVGVIAGWGKIQAQTNSTVVRVDKIEDKLEVLKASTDKNETRQESIKDKVDNIDAKLDKIVSLMLQEKGKEKR